MRRSILLTALALGAQAAWAQDATDPVTAEDEVVVEETTETVETVEEATDDGDGTDVMEEVTEVVEDDPLDDEDEMVEDDAVLVGGDEIADDGGEAVRHDNRSARGAFRGGHHGQVSTLARAGLGPVFGKLRSQGYGDIAIEQAGNEISISAARAGETRQLVYDASTGALLSDVSETSSGGIFQSLSKKMKKESTVSSKRARSSEASGNDGGKGRGKDRGGSDRKSNGNGKGGGKDKGGKGSGNGKNGGNGKGKNR
jgi:hypothetical protein